MLHTKGIVFRVTRFRESSVIADIYTEEKGLQSFLMNGVYGAKTSRLSALFQVGQLVDLVTYFSEKKDVHRIKEIASDYLCLEIPNHIVKSAMATFMIELCRHAIRDQTSNRELFQFIKRCIMLLDHQEVADPNFHLKFMIRLSALLGFQLQNNFGGENESFDLLNAVFTSYNERDPYHMHPSLSRLLSALLRDQTEHIDYENRQSLLQWLLQYYRIHVENFGELKSPQVYKRIF